MQQLQSGQSSQGIKKAFYWVIIVEEAIKKTENSKYLD